MATWPSFLHHTSPYLPMETKPKPLGRSRFLDDRTQGSAQNLGKLIIFLAVLGSGSKILTWSSFVLCGLLVCFARGLSVDNNRPSSLLVLGIKSSPVRMVFILSWGFLG